MEELYELHFHGNRQEIEKEKQRKRELMSHFPKMLGTVDETRYVLEDDDNKSKFENGFGNKEIDVLPVAVISDESEKTKEQKSISSFDNNRKTISFDSWKEGSMFLEPKKENRTLAQKLPFDFDGHTAKEENIPFNHGIQFPGLSTVRGKQPRTTTVRNDSLALEKDKIENRIDSVWNINDKSNFDLNKNNSSSTSKRTLKVHGKPRTKDYAVQINTLIGNLPVAAADILKQHVAEIEVLDNLYTTTDKGEYRKRNGIYLDKSNRIYIDSKHVNEYTMFSEAVHVVQDHLGMTGIGKSNLEFQEHVIKDLYYSQKRRKLYGGEGYDEHSASKDNEYIYLMELAFDENGVLNLNKFLIGINNFINSFQKEYLPSDSYQTPAVKDFNYNWIELLQIFGIEYK